MTQEKYIPDYSYAIDYTDEHSVYRKMTLAALPNNSFFVLLETTKPGEQVQTTKLVLTEIGVDMLRDLLSAAPHLTRYPVDKPKVQENDCN